MRRHLLLVVQSSCVRRFLLSEDWGEVLAPAMYLSTVPGRHHCSLQAIGGDELDLRHTTTRRIVAAEWAAQSAIGKSQAEVHLACGLAEFCNGPLPW